MALLNVFPPLDLSDRRPHHHLRQLPSSQQAQSQSTTEQKKGTETAPLSKADIVAERRRARAMKILDAKMAELAKEPEGWDDVGVSILYSIVTLIKMQLVTLIVIGGCGDYGRRTCYH